MILAAGLIAAAAITLAPPFGSSDHLSYAAYGPDGDHRPRPVHHHSGRAGPAGRPGGAGGPGLADSRPVYGSLATGGPGAGLADRRGRRSGSRCSCCPCSRGRVRRDRLLLHRLTRGTGAASCAPALLWTANPLLLQVLWPARTCRQPGDRLRASPRSPSSRSACASQPPGNPPAAAAGRRRGRVRLTGLGPRSSAVGLVAAGLAWSAAGLAAAPGTGPEPAQARRRDRAQLARRPADSYGGVAGGFAVTARRPPALGAGRRATRRCGQASFVSIGSPWRAVRSACTSRPARRPPGTWSGPGRWCSPSCWHCCARPRSAGRSAGPGALPAPGPAAGTGQATGGGPGAAARAGRWALRYRARSVLRLAGRLAVRAALVRRARLGAARAAAVSRLDLAAGLRAPRRWPSATCRPAGSRCPPTWAGCVRGQDRRHPGDPARGDRGPDGDAVAARRRAGRTGSAGRSRGLAVPGPAVGWQDEGHASRGTPTWAPRGPSPRRRCAR